LAGALSWLDWIAILHVFVSEQLRFLSSTFFHQTQSPLQLLNITQSPHICINLSICYLLHTTELYISQNQSQWASKRVRICVVVIILRRLPCHLTLSLMSSIRRFLHFPFYSI
jgi:hypothetical protein